MTNDPDFIPDDLVPDRVEVGSLTMSPEIDKIAAALAKAQAKIEHVTKDGKGNYGKYATLSSSLNAIRDTFSANEIAIVQAPGGPLGVLELTTTLIHASGQWMASTISINAGASGAAHDVGKATTYARRYALLAMTGGAPEDDDGQHAQDAASRAPAKRPPAKKRNATKPEPTPPGTLAKTSKEMRDLGQALRAVGQLIADGGEDPPGWQKLAAEASGVNPWPEHATPEQVKAAHEGLAKMRSKLTGSDVMP